MVWLGLYVIVGWFVFNMFLCQNKTVIEKKVFDSKLAIVSGVLAWPIALLTLGIMYLEQFPIFGSLVGLVSNVVYGIIVTVTMPLMWVSNTVVGVMDKILDGFVALCYPAPKEVVEEIKEDE